VAFLDNVEKCSGAGQATHGTMAHAHFMLDTQDYKQLSEYVILSPPPHYNNRCMNAPHCNVYIDFFCTVYNVFGYNGS